MKEFSSFIRNQLQKNQKQINHQDQVQGQKAQSSSLKQEGCLQCSQVTANER